MSKNKLVCPAVLEHIYVSWGFKGVGAELASIEVYRLKSATSPPNPTHPSPTGEKNPKLLLILSCAREKQTNKQKKHPNYYLSFHV